MTARTFVLRMSDVGRCPKRSILPRHYRDDGSCECAHPETRQRAEALDAEIRLLNAQAALLRIERDDLRSRL